VTVLYRTGGAAARLRATIATVPLIQAVGNQEITRAFKG
jgi:hypothetical protein